MANFFGNGGAAPATTPRGQLESRYASARANLLLVVVFTAVNLALLIFESGTYFLFSAYIPYLLTGTGMVLCGMYDLEVYGEELEGIQFFDSSVFYILLAISLVMLALYLISWIFSKKQGGWLIFALVFFGLDTLGMLWLGGFSMDSIVDVLFHAWVIFSLVSGVIAHAKLKKLPPEEAAPPVEWTVPPEFAATAPAEEETTPREVPANSPVLRLADQEVKARVLAEAQALDYTITYRRVKRTNELVINGRVYDEWHATIETAHTLTAQIDGHLIQAGFDGTTSSYILVDGQQVAKKLRLY